LGLTFRASAAATVMDAACSGNGVKISSRDHGKSAARGAYSSATVRGTVYTVKDTCAGTLTKVSRAIVSVRDFHRRKTITLRAGHSYLAKAPNIQR